MRFFLVFLILTSLTFFVGCKSKKEEKIVLDSKDLESQMIELYNEAYYEFLENGDKVKITLRFRGREMAHQELGTELLERVASDTSNL